MESDLHFHSAGNRDRFAVEILLDRRYLPHTRFRVWAGGVMVNLPGDDLEILDVVKAHLLDIAENAGQRSAPELWAKDANAAIQYLNAAIYGDSWPGPESTYELSRRYAKFFVLRTESLADSFRIALLEEVGRERLLWTRDWGDVVHEVVLPEGYVEQVAAEAAVAIDTFIGRPAT